MNSWKENDEYYITSAPLQGFKKMEAFYLNILHKNLLAREIKNNIWHILVMPS